MKELYYCYLNYGYTQGLEEGMRLRPIPNTDTLVSEICLGTMMFGDQVNKNNAFQQLDVATKELGINFIVRYHILMIDKIKDNIVHLIL